MKLQGTDRNRPSMLTVASGKDRGIAVMCWVQHVLPKVNLAGTRLQAGHDRSLRRVLNHTVPAAKLPVARCFRTGVTLRERSLFPLTQPRQVPCPVHRQNFATDRSVGVSMPVRADYKHTFANNICETKLFQNKCTDEAFAFLCCYAAYGGRRAKTTSTPGRKPEISQMHLSFIGHLLTHDG